MRPEGATGIKGNARIWINIKKSIELGAEFVSERDLIKDMKKLAEEQPEVLERSKKWQAAQIGEREVLFKGKIKGDAIDTIKTRKIRWFGRGFQILGLFLTAYDYGNATAESVKLNSSKPLIAESVRQTGSWGTAWAGAKVGIGLGALAGIKTGPGAIITGIGGGFIFGTAGYIGADWIADHIHRN